MSCAQVANVDVVRHTFSTAVHVESALHVHEADPEGPVQLWCAPGHATAVPHWPFDPHVSTPVPEHRVPVGVHTVEPLDAELLLVELLELVEVPVLVLVVAMLDAELLGIVELPVLVEVTPPVIAELRDLLVLVEVPVPLVPDVEPP